MFLFVADFIIPVDDLLFKLKLCIFRLQLLYTAPGRAAMHASAAVGVPAAGDHAPLPPPSLLL